MMRNKISKPGCKTGWRMLGTYISIAYPGVLTEVIAGFSNMAEPTHHIHCPGVGRLKIVLEAFQIGRVQRLRLPSLIGI